MLSYSLLPAELEVEIDGKPYTLREASEGAAVQWRDVTINGARMEDGKVVGVQAISVAEPLLVSLCLFEKTEKGERNVSLQTVKNWPARVVKDLFENAKKISHLHEADESVEALEKKLAETQAKLDKKRGKPADEGEEKN